jgi:ABC-type multidrug transport system fused ATPase/permease subunit
MRDYLKRVLELAKPYRVRFGLGLLCGFLAGALAPTLGLSLKLAVDVVFPQQTEGTSSAALTRTNSATPVSSVTVTNSLDAAALSPALAGTNVAVASEGKGSPAAKKGLLSSLPAPLQERLDSLAAWFRPGGKPSWSRLLLVISLIPATMLLRCILSYLNTYLLSWVGIRAASDLRVRLFSHLMNMPLGFFSWTSTGDLMQRFEGAMAVNSTIKDCFGVIIREPISVLTLIVGLVAMQPVLSLFTLMIFPVCLVPVIIFGRKFRKSDRGIHGKFANLSNVMHESFTGIRVIKGYNLEGRMLDEYRRATQAVTSLFMRAVRAGELPGPLIEFIGSIGVAFVFAYFAFFASAHVKGSTTGDLMAFFFMVFSLYAPLKNLSRLQHQLTMAKAGVDPAYQLLAIKTDFCP